MSTAVESELTGPLAGLVIADFSRVLAGPYCTMLLADMGATVIKVEGPGGDDTRNWIPPHRDGVSTYYMSINRNKSSIVLDMSKPEDLEIAYDIIDRADVFVENFKPGSLSKFGLDPQAVAARWPHLIHASITGFGTTGGKEMPGYDLLAQALSGMMTLTGDPDGPPQRTGVAVFDVMTGLHATVAILGALQDRNLTGQGQHVGVNLLSSAVSGLVNQTMGVAGAGNIPTRMGNDHPSLFPYGPLRAADRELVICCGNDAQFARLVRALGIAHISEDARFAGMAVRNANREQLRTILEDALATETADNWFTVLQAQKIPCSPILNVAEGLEFATDLGLQPVVTAGQGENAVPTISHPATFSRSTIRYDKAPPALGADHDSVVEWITHTAPRNATQNLPA